MDFERAARNCMYAADVEIGEPPHRRLYLGPDVAGNLLEVVALQLDDGDEMVIHAMRMRPKYRKLLPRGLAS